MTKSKISWTLTIVIWCSVLGLGTGSSFNADGPRHPPTQHSAVVGGYVVFDCELDFPQDIEIPYILNWNKGGKTIFSWYDGSKLSAPEYADRILLLNEGQDGYGKGSINLTAIRESDMGWYECKVMFPNRTPISRNNGTWFRLEIEGENLIAIPPVNETTLEGKEAQFQCVAKQPNSTVVWYKDGEAIVDLANLGQRSWVDQDGSLNIKPTSMGDFGEYMCEIFNSTGHSQSAKAYLDIQYKAKVIFAPRELYLPYGRPSVLDCHFRANPPLTNLYWEKDGFLFDPYNVRGVFFRGNGSLYFNKVDESHAGQYSCTPHNILGTEGPSPKIKVIVQRPPVFIATPNSIYIRKLGDSITIPCDAIDSEGQQKPTIIWTRRDGSAMPEGRHYQEVGNLTLENLQEDDRGMYQCSATNEAATIQTETELMIENVPPRAPFNLVATSTTDSVTLRWTPASTYMRPEMEYSVWFRSARESDWKKIPIQSAHLTEATISSLQPGREYEFMVHSQDRFSDGMFSKSLRFRTKDNSDEVTETIRETLEASAEMGPPRDIAVHVTADGYLVNWSPPNHGMDVLRGYVIRWFGSDNKIVGIETTDKNYCIIKDLEEGEEYHFQVDAVSNNNFKAMGNRVTIQIPSYGKIKATVAGVSCIIILLLVAAGVWYTRQRQKNKNKEEEENSQKIFNSNK